MNVVIWYNFEIIMQGQLQQIAKVAAANFDFACETSQTTKMNENDDDFVNLKTIPVKASWVDSLPLTMNNTGKQVQYKPPTV